MNQQFKLNVQKNLKFQAISSTKQWVQRHQQKYISKISNTGEIFTKLFAACSISSSFNPLSQELMIQQINKTELLYTQGIIIPGQSTPQPSGKKLILPGQDLKSSAEDQIKEPVLTHSYSSLTGQEKKLTDIELTNKEADLKTKIQIAGIGNEEIPMMLQDIALECFKLGQFEKALIYNQQLMIYLSTIQKADFQTQKLFVQTFQNIGQLLIRIGDPHNGLKFIGQAIERLKSLGGTGHMDMSKLYNDQGLAHLYLEEFDKSMSAYQDALAVRNLAYGEKRELDTEDAVILNNLGVAQNYAEKFAEATETFTKSLNIYKKTYGDEKNLLYINSLENLGFSLGGQGQMDKQIEYLKKAMILKQEHHPSRLIEIANTQLQIGQSYERLGQIDQAELYYDQSLKARKSFYGDKNSPDMGQTLLQIGQVKHAKQDFQNAKKYYNQALPHFEKKSSEHALVLNLLGAVHETEGNLTDALDYHQKALQINQQVHGIKAYQNLVSLHNMCQVNEKLGKFEQAVAYKEQIADIIIKSKRNSDVEVIGVLQELSVLQKKANKLENALESNQQMLELAKKAYGEETTNTAQVYQQMGEIYEQLKDKQNSLEYFKKCYEIRKKTLPENNNQIKEVQQLISKVESSL